MKESYAWLFLPDELDALAGLRQPVPGDVLLLDSRSWSGATSRIARGFGRYSHIGTVIGADLYIDAVSTPGVSVRKVADLSTGLISCAACSRSSPTNSMI